MFGTTELLILFGIAMLLFGPQKLPELARSMGSAISEFKKAKDLPAKEIEYLKK